MVFIKIHAVSIDSISVKCVGGQINVILFSSILFYSKFIVVDPDLGSDSIFTLDPR
jgi:hypothetical protein